MSHDGRRIRFGLWYDFRNPPQWSQCANRLYREILDQIVLGEANGFDDVWLSEHHFIATGENRASPREVLPWHVG